MNKKGIIIMIIILLIALFPIRMIYKDGGTRTYTSLTYKVIIWNQLEDADGNKKEGIEIHLFPNNFHDLSYYDD